MPGRVVPNGALTAFPSTQRDRFDPWWEKAVSDLIYIAAGVVVLLLFAGYAALLRRA
jgi:hypothetical protein